MSKQRPVLSISLLCSGRAKTTKKCLDSIQHLRDTVANELIIVDTGCDEEMRNLIESYADKIVEFEWCNDFSKARNAGLREAKGEWFLYLDDDEWFMDTKEIEDFFLSGEYKRYGHACYIQHNYLSRKKDVFTDAWVSRMVRMEKDTRFISSIHERFTPMRNPRKLIHCQVEHFGYIFDSPEEEREHLKRNMILLQDMVEKDPHEMRWWIHLANEYRAAREYQKLMDLCRDALKRIDKRKDLDATIDRGCFYCGLVEAQLLSAYLEESEKSLQNALSDKRNTDYCNMRLYNMAEEIYYKLGDFEKGLYYGEKYMEMYELMKDDEEKKQDESTFFVMTAFEQPGISTGFCFYILNGMKLGNTKPLKERFFQLGWDGMLMLYNRFIHDLIFMWGELPYEEEFVPMAQKMAKRKGMDVLCDTLEEVEKQAKNAAPDSVEKKRLYHVARIFSQVEATYHHIWYLKILYADYTENVSGLSGYYEKLFHYVADIFELEDDVFSIAEKYEVNLAEQFAKIPFDQWRLGIDNFFKNNKFEKASDRAAVVMRSMPEKIEDPMLATKYDYFFMKAAEADVAYIRPMNRYIDVSERFRIFTDRCLSFYRRYYKDSAFEGEMEMLPQAARLAVKWQKVIEAESKGDRRLLNTALREAIGVYSALDDAVSLYTKLYALGEKIRLDQEEKAEKEKAAEISNEMQMLASQIKAKIPLLLEQNMASEAYQVLLQLQALVPQDEELPALEKKILGKMS